MGSFEADITLPDLKKSPLKMSSIVLASHAQAEQEQDPLVRKGEEYVPDIATSSGRTSTFTCSTRSTTRRTKNRQKTNQRDQAWHRPVVAAWN